MVDLILTDDGFGAELRRRRNAAGFSLRELAERVHYSYSHLSKVETAGKPPSLSLARLCDEVLDAGGALSGLVREEPHDRTEASHADDGRVVRVELFPAPTKRWRRPPAIEIGEGFLRSGRDLLRSMREFGQNAPPAAVLPMALSAAMTMRDMAMYGDPGGRVEALLLASRFAEYAGWMAQEAGDDNMAVGWTEAAVTLAATAGDHTLGAYALVRRGLMTMYRRDAAGTIHFARQAQRMTDDPRVRGLAAQREAQGHALAGDARSCWTALDRAGSLLSEAARHPRDDLPVIGPSYLRDPAAMVGGWCQYDLGNTRAAVQTLTTELARTPEAARRSRALIGARLALSLAAVGEVDEACATAQPVMDTQRAIDSATIATDLRQLRAVLRRWHTHPAVRRISPGLAATARRRTGGALLPPSYRPELLVASLTSRPA